MTKRAARERLHRIRERASSARAVIATERSTPRRPLTERVASVCGTWADHPPARRLIERNHVEGSISVRRLGSFGFEVPVRDVSVAGCKVELVEPVTVRDNVIARLPGLEPFSATVIWSNERCAGLQFNRPLHPAVFDMLLERLG